KLGRREGGRCRVADYSPSTGPTARFPEQPGALPRFETGRTTRPRFKTIHVRGRGIRDAPAGASLLVSHSGGILWPSSWFLVLSRDLRIRRVLLRHPVAPRSRSPPRSFSRRATPPSSGSLRATEPRSSWRSTRRPSKGLRYTWPKGVQAV